MKLFDSAISGNCYKVRLLLAHLGRSYERVAVDVVAREKRSPTLGGRTPIGRVPVLELDDGSCLAESNAILFHLAQGTPFLPDDDFDRCQVLQWLFFEQGGHEPAISTARYWISIVGEEKQHRESLALLQQAGHSALNVMEQHLAGHSFFVNERYSIADMSLYAYTHVAPEGGFDLEGYPRVGNWLRRVREQSGHVEMIEGEDTV